jgi:nucleotide-binding universal stress UspA family protein
MKRILVALDGSPRSTTILAAAERLAGMAGAKLVLYRAIGLEVQIPREVLRVTDTTPEDILRQNARTELERIAEAIPRSMVERYVVEFATAWDGICRTAKTEDVDLVVIGSHGYGGLDRVLGTTASKVVNRIDRNVLVVRTPL